MTSRLTLWASLAGVLLICGLALYFDGRADSARRLRAEVAAAQSAADRHALEAQGERDTAFSILCVQTDDGTQVQGTKIGTRPRSCGTSPVSVSTAYCSPFSTSVIRRHVARVHSV